MKNLNDLSNSHYLDESITQDYSYAGGFLGDIQKGLSDAGKSIETAAKEAGKNIKGTAKDIGQNIERTTKEIGQNIERTAKEISQNKELKKVLKANFLTYNPAIAIPRSSALLCFRVNLFGISSRLYPAFLDEAALKKGNFNLENAEKAKKAWEDVANFWEDKLGGDRKKLKEAISGAWNKPIFKTKKSQARRRSTASFDGLDLDCINNVGDISTFYEDERYSNTCAEPYSCAATAAYITAGLSVVTAIVDMITKKGASKNPYNNGTPEANNFNNQLAEGGTPPPLNQDELNKAMAAAESDRKKGLGLDDTGLDLFDVNEDGTVSRKSGKILGMPKGVAIGLGVALVLLGGFFVYKKYIKK